MSKDFWENILSDSLDINNRNIVFFDNCEHSVEYRNTDYRTTRAMEISIDETGEVPVSEIIWEYDLPEDLFSLASGNVQKLQIENYLITTVGSSDGAHSLEVTQSGNIVSLRINGPFVVSLKIK